MGTMAKFYKDEEAGNYHLLLRPFTPADPENPAQGGTPDGGQDTITEIIWTPDEANAAFAAMVPSMRDTHGISMDRDRRPEGS